MIKRTAPARAAAVLALGVGAVALTAAPAATAAASGAHPAGDHLAGTRVVATHAAAPVRPYDRSLLTDVNDARANTDHRSYAMSTKLGNVAFNWAKHLARTETLEHNPDLVRDITKVCPHWTQLGENVGDSSGDHAGSLFTAYMHSPPHRANILDSHFTVVGIETVTVVRNGQSQQWNVMDFANHCG